MGLFADDINSMENRVSLTLVLGLKVFVGVSQFTANHGYLLLQPE